MLSLSDDNKNHLQQDTTVPVFEPGNPERGFKTTLDPGLPKPGETAEGYRLDSIFHTGCMTTLYRAVNEHTGSPCTVIICRQHSSREFRRSFSLSRNLQARIGSSSIARILGGGTLPGDIPYAVREYFPGKTVGSALSVTNKFSPEVCRAVASSVATILAEVADCVEELQWAGYFRRCLWRITPHDMVVTPDGMFHLLSHGISHHFDVRLLQPDLIDPPYSPTMDVTTILHALGVLIAVMLDGHACGEAECPNITADADRDQHALRLIATRCGVPFYGEQKTVVRPFSSLFELRDALASPRRRPDAPDSGALIAAYFAGKQHA